MSAKGLITFLVFISSIEARGTRVRRDLGDVCQKMWDAAGNNMVIGTDLTVDTTSATKLFTVTPSGQTKLKKSVYVTFKALLDRYATAPLSAAHKPEEDDFIKAIAVAGGPVATAFNYLKAKGKIAAANLEAFKPVLKKTWFGKYSKKSTGLTVIQYSGFEHTFVGEIVRDKKTVVKGLHNWYQILLEQAAKRLVYTPPPKKIDFTKQPPLINVAYTWNGVSKPPGSSFYVGTSPAFEMGLYTACFFEEPGDCSCSINGKPLVVKTINFNNAGMVLTSYPVA